MDAKTVFNKIASLVGVQKEVNLSFGGDEYGKLQDGGAVATDAFEVGHILFVIGEDGQKSLAPDAEHKIFLPTQNGSKLYNVVTKDGIISQLELLPQPGKQLEMEKQNLAKVEGPDGEMVDKVAVEGPKPEMDKEEKVSMQEGEDMASRLDSLEAQVKQLRDDIANLFNKEENMKKMYEKMQELAVTYNEEAKVKDILKGGVGVGGQGKPNDGGPVKMSSQKKFTGAPVEEAKPFEKPLVNYSKQENSINKVFAKMANSKF